MPLTTQQRVRLQREYDNLEEAHSNLSVLFFRSSFPSRPGERPPCVLPSGDLGTIRGYVETKKELIGAKLKNRSIGRLQAQLGALLPEAQDAYRNAWTIGDGPVLDVIQRLVPELAIEIESPRVEDPFVTALRKLRQTGERSGVSEQKAQTESLPNPEKPGVGHVPEAPAPSSTLPPDLVDEVAIIREAVFRKVSQPDKYRTLRTDEAAAYFDCDKRTINRWVRRHKLKAGEKLGTITIESIKKLDNKPKPKSLK